MDISANSLIQNLHVSQMQNFSRQRNFINTNLFGQTQITLLCTTNVSISSLTEKINFHKPKQSLLNISIDITAIIYLCTLVPIRRFYFKVTCYKHTAHPAIFQKINLKWKIYKLKPRNNQWKQHCKQVMLLILSRRLFISKIIQDTIDQSTLCPGKK